MPSPARLVLASSSAYRKELLARLRYPFDIHAPDIDERPLAKEMPEQTALRLARSKAAAVSACHPGALVIGSDQVATLDGQQIGKPGNHTNALAQLRRMQGRSVIFHTAVCLIDGRLDSTGSPYALQLENVKTTVTFRRLPDAELVRYLELERPYDCAGSAKVEGLGITLLERVESDDPTALIGLPLVTLTTMLRNVGAGIPDTLQS